MIVNGASSSIQTFSKHNLLHANGKGIWRGFEIHAQSCCPTAAPLLHCLSPRWPEFIRRLPYTLRHQHSALACLPPQLPTCSHSLLSSFPPSASSFYFSAAAAVFPSPGSTCPRSRLTRFPCSCRLISMFCVK